VTQTKDDIWILLELCNGGDLEKYRFYRGGFLAEPEARLILKQIVAGIVAIKDKGCMHRDLKLSNVVLNFSEIDKSNVLHHKVKIDEYI